jgi:hypothetical protein
VGDGGHLSILTAVNLEDELVDVAARAAAHAAADEVLSGVIATEPVSGERVYLCSFERADRRTWLALDAGGSPITSRSLVREAASIAALCELAEETAGGGKLEELRKQLVTLRLTEAPLGIAEAEEAALALERAIVPPPRVASAGYLDALGGAARRLEQALGDSGQSPFSTAMQQAVGAAEELAEEVQACYRLELR